MTYSEIGLVQTAYHWRAVTPPPGSLGDGTAEGKPAIVAPAPVAFIDRLYSPGSFLNLKERQTLDATPRVLTPICATRVARASLCKDIRGVVAKRGELI